MFSTFHQDRHLAVENQRVDRLGSVWLAWLEILSSWSSQWCDRNASRGIRNALMYRARVEVL